MMLLKRVNNYEERKELVSLLREGNGMLQELINGVTKLYKEGNISKFEFSVYVNKSMETKEYGESLIRRISEMESVDYVGEIKEYVKGCDLSADKYLIYKEGCK